MLNIMNRQAVLCGNMLGRNLTELGRAAQFLEPSEATDCDLAVRAPLPLDDRVDEGPWAWEPAGDVGARADGGLWAWEPAGDVAARADGGLWAWEPAGVVGRADGGLWAWEPAGDVDDDVGDLNFGVGGFGGGGVGVDGYTSVGGERGGDKGEYV